MIEIFLPIKGGVFFNPFGTVLEKYTTQGLKGHTGTDILPPYGSDRKVRAVKNGVITAIGGQAPDAYVVQQHGDYEIIYGHITDVPVGVGVVVKAGDILGKVEDHLHLGLRPLPYIENGYNGCIDPGPCFNGIDAQAFDILTSLKEIVKALTKKVEERLKKK